MTPHPTGPEAAPQQQQPAPAADAAPAPVKKKRNLPGTPDPDAEVIALSPGTLLATNRFVCEVCGKGFQRDQNLQLHRRGHNLPWRLRQRGPGAAPPRRRVYVCPQPGCVHHSPSRALGDLTGIKKHFCRKHGEKRWACPRCAKRYAVQADLKAHAKTCGTREYRCDCGTLFTRRDSFVTHRAFCGALVEETGRVLAPPAPPSPRPPDLEAEAKEDKGDDEENEDSAVAEVEQPPRHAEAVPEEPPRGPSPPPLPQEPPRGPSPPPLPQEPPRGPSPPPLPQEPPRGQSPPPLPQEPPRRLSPPPLPKEQPRRPSPPPLPKEPQRVPRPLPFPLEQPPVVEVVPNADEPEVVAVPTVAAKLEDEADQDEKTCFQEADQYKDAELEVSNLLDKDTPMLPCFLPSPSEAIGTDGSSTTCGAGGSVSNSMAPSTTNTFAGLFSSATRSTTSQSRSLRDLIGVDPTFLCLAIGAPSSLFPQTSSSNPVTFAPPPAAPHMSATALLQKAAEVGASQSSSSFLKEFGLASSSSSSTPSKQLPQGRVTDNIAEPWQHRRNQQMEMEHHRNHQHRDMESSSQPWHRHTAQQMEMERRRNHQPQQRELESSSQPWHRRTAQPMEMERRHRNHQQQREMESSSQQWQHYRNDQPMEIERYRSNNQQVEMESSFHRWAHHHRSNQQMEAMERQQRRSNQQAERESTSRGGVLSGSLGLGLAYQSGNSGLPELVMGPSPLFGPKPATLDFLGLGIGGTMGSATANGGLPALMVGGELDMGSSAQMPAPWEEAKRKTNGRTIL